MHVIGNHCLSVDRAVLMQRLRVPEPGYYSIPLPARWRLLVLDTTELGGDCGYPPSSWQYKEARKYEQEHPLSEEEPQMVPWNGGVSQRQLRWLECELCGAAAAGERVIVAAHHQFGPPGAARRTHVAWNHGEIRRVCLESPAFRLALAGHDHVGGFSSGGACQHFVTLEAVLEAPEGSNAYGLLSVFEDRLEIRGKGSLTSRMLAV